MAVSTMKQDVKISIDDLISKIKKGHTPNANVEKNNLEVEDNNDIIFLNFIAELKKEEKYKNVIQILENKKLSEDSFSEKYMEFIKTSVIVKKANKHDEFITKFKKITMAAIVIGGAVVYFVPMFWPLMVFASIFLICEMMRYKRKNKLLNEQSLSERGEFIANIKNVWFNIKNTNKEKYNPYAFIYFALKGLSTDVEILNSIFKEFDFEKLDLDITELSNIFFSSHDDKYSEERYDDLVKYNITDISQNYVDANYKRENTQKLYKLKKSFAKDKGESIKKKIIDHFTNDEPSKSDKLS